MIIGFGGWLLYGARMWTSLFLAPTRRFLFLEAFTLFILTPSLLWLQPTRLNVHGGLWLVTLYAIALLRKMPDFSWRAAWQGILWTRRDLGFVLARFAVSTAGIILLTLLIKPDRFLMFPTQRPVLWIVVMVLYPLLSALPQELVFRTFFFRRYAPLFRNKAWMMAVSAFVFGYIHIVFHNPVSPLLSFICGFFLSASYAAHQSLKKAAIEHALYGDMVFTVGLGYYFLVNPVF